MPRFQFPLPVLALVFMVPASAQNPETGPVAFVNVNVLPMDREQVRSRQTVVIERGVITRIGPGEIPPGALQIDGSGKFLIPGLVDLHVHLASNPEEEQRQLLQLFMAQGVTTILNMRGTEQTLALRTALAEGRVLGPTLYTVGPYVNQPFVTKPEEVEQAVVEQKRAGYDFIKLHGDLSSDAYSRLMSVARREGIRVIGHAPRNLGVEAMFRERQYAVVHAEEYIYDTTNRSRDQDLPQVEARIPSHARNTARVGIWLMPNLTAFRAIGEMVNDLDSMLARPEMRHLPTSVQQGWGPATNPYTARIGKERYPAIMARVRILQRLTHEFHRAGVRLAIGTDAMNTGVVPGFSTHDEMQELVNAGLTPFEALRAATANAAEFLDDRAPSGLVAVGHRADLVLLDANPLEHIANTRRITGVMLRGRWFPRSEIDEILNRLRSP